MLYFNINGDFANFRDQSITTSNVTYSIPPKTTVIGIIASVLGIGRKNEATSDIKDAYSDEYLDLFKSIKVGMRVLSKNIQKIDVVTNHITLINNTKGGGVKPFKVELLVKPHYQIFVYGDKNLLSKVKANIEDGNYKYTPFLGNAYCLAKLYNPTILNQVAEVEDPNGKITSSVIVGADLTLQQKGQEGQVIVENHLHFIPPDKRETFDFWIPVNGKFAIDDYKQDQNLGCKFVELDFNRSKEAVCLY
ncbi:MAG: CRISPR-associated protein Cas5 [Thermoplasmata archaeon]